MNKLSANDHRICPACGAKVSIKASKCWMCNHRFTRDTPGAVHPPVPSSGIHDDSAKAAPSPDSLTRATSESAQSTGPVTARIADRPGHDEYQRHATFQFGLSTIMLIITIAAVLLGVYEMAPGLGIALAIAAIIALIPTSIISMQKSARGRPLTTLEKFGVFAAWVCMPIIVIVSSGIAFFFTCLGTFSAGGGRLPSIGAAGGGTGSDRLIGAALIFGGIAAIAVAVLLIWFFRRVYKWTSKHLDSGKRTQVGG